MYFAGKEGGGALIVRAQLGAHAIGLMGLYEALPSGDLAGIATDGDARPDAARFDLSEAFLKAKQWGALPLRLRVRGVNHGSTDFPIVLRVLQGEADLPALDADGEPLEPEDGGYKLGSFTSGPDHFPQFTVFFR